MDKKEIIFFVVIIGILVLCGWMITMIRSEVAQCVKNPYLYGASKMGNVACSCQQFNNQQCPALFYFNDTNFETPINECGSRTGLVQKINLDDFDDYIVTP